MTARVSMSLMVWNSPGMLSDRCFITSVNSFPDHSPWWQPHLSALIEAHTVSAFAFLYPPYFSGLIVSVEGYLVSILHKHLCHSLPQCDQAYSCSCGL